MSKSLSHLSILPVVSDLATEQSIHNTADLCTFLPIKSVCVYKCRYTVSCMYVHILNVPNVCTHTRRVEMQQYIDKLPYCDTLGGDNVSIQI